MCLFFCYSIGSPPFSWDMESYGKQVWHDGQGVSIQTGPVIWGGVGCNGQHAYHQLLHEGST
ncbi:hypothetical protein EMIT043CA1_50262 [Pseudomonas brassicacearum]